MAYCTPSEVRGPTGILLNIDATVISDSAVNEFIEMADNMINVALSKRYTIPFDDAPNTPPVINTISKSLAAYFVMNSLYSQEGQNINEWVNALKEKAEMMLEQLKNGEAKLFDINGQEITQKEVDDISSTTQNYTPIFDVDSDLNWKVDDDRLNDIDNARE